MEHVPVTKQETPAEKVQAQTVLDRAVARLEEWDERVRGGYMNIQPDSSLDFDNEYLGPDGTGSLPTNLILSSISNLQTLRLVLDAKTLPLTGHYPMLRAALETASTAFWLLEPDERDTRLTRYFRLMRAEIDDALNFRDTLGEKGIHDTRQQRKAALRELHNRRPTAGRWNDICGQLSTTSILKEVDRAREVHDPTSAPTHLGVFASWQLYSGLSHGKHWATLVALDRLDQSLGESSDVKSVMLTSSLKLVAHGMQTGVSLLDLTLRTYGKRARRWSALPEDSKEPKKTNYPARGG